MADSDHGTPSSCYYTGFLDVGGGVGSNDTDTYQVQFVLEQIPSKQIYTSDAT